MVSAVARIRDRLRSASAHRQPLDLDRKRVVILLRAVVIATCAYLVMMHDGRVPTERLAYVVAFGLSNLALGFVPRRIFEHAQFGPLLLLADTALILFGLSLGAGLSQDLVLVYFFTIFLTTVGGTLGQVATGSALIAALYGYWLASRGQPLEPEAWVRLPFFFLIAVFYGMLTEQLKLERSRRRNAEHESEHLRLMLELAGLFSETHATREFVLGIGRFIEGTCPGLRCRMALHDDPLENEDGRETFQLRAHGRQYGALCVEAERELSERERWLCQMVAHAAAGALYASEQSDAAHEAADAKELFLANVSHEFRTPLHAILGYIDMIDGVLAESAEPLVSESIGRLRVNTCRLQSLLEELLSFAEIRAGRRAMRVEQLSLGEMITGLEPITRELLGGKSVELSSRIGEAADEVWTDGRRLERVLSCLLSNAAKFTERGRVTLTTRRLTESIVEIEVTDTGIGISRSDQRVIFDDFRQVDGSFTRRYGGLGLGLALARELVTMLDGTMELDSEPGLGTSVRVRIPCALPPRADAYDRPFDLASGSEGLAAMVAGGPRVVLSS